MVQRSEEGGWYRSVRINDQITTNHNAVFLGPSPTLPLSVCDTRRQETEGIVECRKKYDGTRQGIVGLGGECDDGSGTQRICRFIIMIILRIVTAPFYCLLFFFLHSFVLMRLTNHFPRDKYSFVYLKDICFSFSASSTSIWYSFSVSLFFSRCPSGSWCPQP